MAWTLEQWFFLVALKSCWCLTVFPSPLVAKCVVLYLWPILDVHSGFPFHRGYDQVGKTLNTQKHRVDRKTKPEVESMEGRPVRGKKQSGLHQQQGHSGSVPVMIFTSEISKMCFVQCSLNKNKCITILELISSGLSTNKWGFKPNYATDLYLHTTYYWSLGFNFLPWDVVLGLEQSTHITGWVFPDLRLWPQPASSSTSF